MASIEILYFAQVRERIGRDGETIEVPAGIVDVAGLVGWLAGQGGGHGAALGDLSALRFAIDQEFVAADASIEQARELAIFPPVTGGVSVRVESRTADFDVGAELARLEALGGGGVASFTGVVRGGGGLVALTLETHAGMAARALDRVADGAMARFDLLGLTLVHRHGRLSPGERIVLCATAARHRGAALDACAFLIDWAKTKAPYWKREEFGDGRTRWIEARVEDDARAGAWDSSRKR